MMECYRCGDLFDDDPNVEGPSDCCLSCRYEVVHADDDEGASHG